MTAVKLAVVPYRLSIKVKKGIYSKDPAWAHLMGRHRAGTVVRTGAGKIGVRSVVRQTTRRMIRAGGRGGIGSV